MITDCEWVCARCLDYRTKCKLCEYEPEDLIPTPQSIKDAEKKLSDSMKPLRMMFPLYH
jgi:hypothetical protein